MKPGRDPIEEWGQESFPASDAATGWSGPEEYADQRIEVQRGELVAFLTYRVEGARLVIIHTEVPEAISGEGVGGELVASAVELAQRRNLTIVPRCPFARRWLSKHPNVRQTVSIDWSS